MNKTLALAIWLLVALPAVADVIHLKNGQKIKVGNAIEDGAYIKCIRWGAEVTYPKDIVERVEYDHPQEPPAPPKHQTPPPDVKPPSRGEEIIRDGIAVAKLQTAERDMYLDQPQNYEQTIRNHLNENLNDPYTVRELEIRQAVRMNLEYDIPHKFLYEGQVIWFSIVSYNAKNSFGAYTGKKFYTYIFRGDDIVSIEEMP